ncbi:unnamed protein product [Caenorhabditis brenneri]
MSKQFVLTHVAENVSKLENDKTMYGNRVTILNIPWKIGYARRNDAFQIYLHREKSESGEVLIPDTKIELKIISVNGKTFSKNTKYIYGINDQTVGFGFPLFMGWNDFNGYLVDDRLIMEAHVTINKVDGDVKKKRLRSFDESTKELSDTVLTVDGEKFYVLRMYLAGQSPYFKALFLGKFAESKQSEVTLKDIDPEDFQTFLEIFHLEPALNDCCIDNILELSHMYQAQNALRICEEYLIKDSNHSMKLKVRLAAKYKLEKLKKHVIESMKTKADVRSVMGPDLKELDASILEELLEKMTSF